ncbi:LptF/LptG family permease [Thetidibacter halocola]|uniref:LptF/LptG family permease n=1 Tax=Thetidibacter halocola TaxID=2827239 RepID=A0A8J7WCJ0_9RHOB|nr:LptF/LptG family permease [Thetidibacter halocola]MBS0124227.1 LptF/LptG family permease [Thetidibacter halocola]
MLSQLMVLFGFFSLVLVLVYWVNRAVVLFDRLIADGHSAGVFLEFTMLSLPAVILQIMPMASFAAAVYVTNRMSGDSELTVVKAVGYSPWRLARPVAIYGTIIALMTAILCHVLVPASIAQLRLREQEISGSVSARLLREGTFLHPARGVTFYIGDIAPDGELRDVLLSDRRQPDRSLTYTAERAYLLRADDGPKLVMISGLAQTMNLEERRLSTTTFADLIYDISGLVAQSRVVVRRLDTVPTLELLTRTEALAEELRERPGAVLQEAHMRFEQPILAMVAALIGFAALQAGTFSRFGVTKQIVGAIFLLVTVKLVESGVSDPVRSVSRLWPLVYLPSVVGLGMVWALLASGGRGWRPRRRGSPPAEAAT